MCVTNIDLPTERERERESNIDRMTDKTNRNKGGKETIEMH